MNTLSLICSYVLFGICLGLFGAGCFVLALSSEDAIAMAAVCFGFSMIAGGVGYSLFQHWKRFRAYLGSNENRFK